MKLFLDSCALIAASMSAVGASRLIVGLTRHNQWELLTTTYVLQEVERRAARFSDVERAEWLRIKGQLTVVRNVWTIDDIMIFPNQKDRPVLCSAMRWADVLITLDRAGFHTLIGRRFFRLRIATPGEFLNEQRELGVLKT